MRAAFLPAAGLLALASGAALAAHGRAGLWNYATTMDMNGAMPPEAMAQMKAMGMAMPAAQTFNSQFCMSQADVDADRPPPAADRQSGCTTRVASRTANGMTAQMTCNGRMKGSGEMSISYSGTDHYTGSYSFKGTMEGRGASMSARFKGDWVKGDCGAVKPQPHP